MPRIGCLLVPLFPLAARLRAEPELAGEAIVILEGDGPTARVAAASRPARQAGIVAGLTLSQARRRLPKVIARARDDAAERAAAEALVECAETISPRFEPTEPGGVFLDTSGLERHHPDERSLARALLLETEKAGLPARFGLADSKLAARIAAERPDSPTIVPSGEDARFLAPLPLARLAEPLGLAETLTRWGVRSIGDLARLPEADVTLRLGPAGHELFALARGHDPRPFVPQPPPATFEEGSRLDWPVVTLEPFLFLLRAALERLGTRLARRGLAAQRLELVLALEPDGWDARPIELPSPTREAKTLTTLARLSLEARPPGAPVIGFTVIAHPDRPRQGQLTLFGPSSPSPDELATTVARLAALLGPDRVGSPRPVDRHRPGGRRLVPYDPPPPPRLRRPPHKGRGLLAVRLLRPPLPLEVLTDQPPPRSPKEATEAPPPRPLELRTLDEAEPGGDDTIVASRPVGVSEAKPPPYDVKRPRRPRLGGRVRIAAGPWRIDEGWWTESPVERDYWDVELEKGELLRVYRDRGNGGWFADGLYD